MMTSSVQAASAERVPLPHQSFFRDGMLLVVCMALAKFALHMFFNNRYGYFRDEFDYIACGNHLAWGYVDQPPLIPLLMRVTQYLFGPSLRSIRFFAAAGSSAVVVLTAMITREFGGRRYALLLSALTIVIAPIYLSDGSLMITNSLEPLLWMGCAYFFILAVKRANPRDWLWYGVVAGIGMQEKYSIAVFGFGTVIGLLLTRQRKFLWNRWIWIGGGVAFLIFLPNLLWNLHYHFPFVQLMHNIKASGRDVVLTPRQYFQQQFLLVHPLTAPIWAGGLLALFFWKPLRPYRALGWCYLAAFTVFAGLHGKNYYLAPIYPMLLAAGTVALESAIERTRQTWLKPAIAVVLAAAGAVLLPLVVPVLPVRKFVAYLDRLPIQVPRNEKHDFAVVLPQYYADQFGWREMTAAVAKIYYSLPPEERAKTAIFGNNYGEAGAIDFLGSKYGLPKAISGHQTYWLWGPRNYTGSTMIVLGDTRAGLAPQCKSVEEYDIPFSPYALEDDPIFVCRGFRWNLQQDWPRLKKWD